MPEDVTPTAPHDHDEPSIEEFIPSRHFQPLDDDCAVDMVAAPENLSFPPGADGDELVMEPVPSRIPRSVSFKDEASEVVPEELAEAPRAIDDSALPSFATYSEKHDNGELARAAREIALKMGRSLRVAAAGSASDSASSDDGGASGEAFPSAAEVLAELRELRHRLTELEKAQRTVASQRGDVRGDDARSQERSSPLSSAPSVSPPLPTLAPASAPACAPVASLPPIETDFGFGNSVEVDRAAMRDPLAPSKAPAAAASATAAKKKLSDAEAGLMAYFTPLATPAATPRSTLDEFFDAQAAASQPNSPRRALAAAAATLVASELGPRPARAARHPRSLSPPPQRSLPPASPPQQPASPPLPPSRSPLAEQPLSPRRLAHLGVSPTALKTRSKTTGLASLLEDRRTLVLSPRLAKGMDYACKAWDDSAMVLRRSNGRSESLDCHPTSTDPGKQGRSKKHEAAAAEAPKKSHLPGPGLAVYDRAADPERVEDELALQRRWVRPATDRTRGIGFLAFLRTDLLAPSTPPVIEEGVPRGVTNFLRVPLLFERFVAFGVFASLDMFLYVLTFLPLRTLFTVGRFALGWAAAPGLAAAWCLAPGLQRLAWQLLVAVLGDPETLRAAQPAAAGDAAGAAAREKLGASGSGGAGSNQPKALRWVRGPRGLFGPDSPWRWLLPTFHRTHGYDLLRMGLFLGALAGLQFLDMSRVYHHIRGQEMIKLYVIISMVEIFDRLLSSFGQDVLDSLYWTVRTRPRSLRLLYEVPIALVYIQLHACLFFVNVATINVAINSADAALMTLLVSNNFAEIKTSVFKKFDANNLFQVASSDATERFKLFVFMVLVLLLNLVQNAEKANQYLGNFWNQIRVVFAAEVVADWIKHAFISKFNGHDAGLYGRFTLVLVQDVTEARHDATQPVLDHTHSLARRIGLAQLPLAAIAARFLQVVWARAVPFFEISAGAQRELLGYGCACLLAAKVLTGILLAGVCAECRIAEETAKAERRKEKESAAAKGRAYSVSKWWA